MNMVDKKISNVILTLVFDTYLWRVWPKTREIVQDDVALFTSNLFFVSIFLPWKILNFFNAPYKIDGLIFNLKLWKIKEIFVSFYQKVITNFWNFWKKRDTTLLKPFWALPQKRWLNSLKQFFLCNNAFFAGFTKSDLL